MKNTFLVITSIAKPDHPVLKKISDECILHQVPFILMGDTRSPDEFVLPGCDFYSISRQQKMEFELAKVLPLKHYSRKNLGYLQAMSANAEVIIETDDDNFPLPGFWATRTKNVQAHLLTHTGWTNVYNYFTPEMIWPRGFALEHIKDKLPQPGNISAVDCPIQQGLADKNPDVDAIYRITLPLPVTFNKSANIALGNGAICPFNSQNTTWFKEAFSLMYLPSYCSFRMTDIWRSFIAQRIAWTCNWPLLFHHSTVRQDRNEHSLVDDFKDEIPGYLNNARLFRGLQELKLPEGVDHIPGNMIRCYQLLVEMELIGASEMSLLHAWLKDIKPYI